MDLAQTISYMKFEKEGDFKTLAARLKAVKHQLVEIGGIMKVGMQHKLTMHAVSMVNSCDMSS